MAAADTITRQRATLLAGVEHVASALFEEDDQRLDHFMERREIPRSSGIVLTQEQKDMLLNVIADAQTMVNNGTMNNMDHAYDAKRGEAFVDFVMRRVYSTLLNGCPPPVVRTRTRFM